MKEKIRLDFYWADVIFKVHLWLKPAQADLLTQRFIY